MLVLIVILIMALGGGAGFYFILKNKKSSNSDVPVVVVPAPELIPEPTPIPESTPTEPLSPKILLNAGYIFPTDAVKPEYYIDIFKACGMVNILPMAFRWPGDEFYMTTYYNACITAGLKPWMMPTDIGIVDWPAPNVPGWANRVISECPEIASAYPNMAGWFGATDLIVTADVSNPRYVTTSDTYLLHMNAALNAMYSAKAMPITFDVFDATGDLNLYKALLKNFLLSMDTCKYLIPNVFVTDVNSLPLVIKHAEACLEAGANYGIMFLQRPVFPFTDLPLLIAELNLVKNYPGVIRTYTDSLSHFSSMAKDYLDYVITNR